MQGLQYMRDQFSGRVELTSLDNARYAATDTSLLSTECELPKGSDTEGIADDPRPDRRRY